LSVSRADRSNGRRRATPVKKVRATKTSDPKQRRFRLNLSQPLWFLIVAAASGLLLFDRFSDVPTDYCRIAAGALTVCFTLGLASRTGGRILWGGVLSSVVVLVGLLTQWTPLLAGSAAATGVLGAMLAVMATTPAATFKGAAREVLVAVLVAFIASLGVVGYTVQLDVNRFGYVVLAASLAGSIGLVYRLGAGLHGLGRRGYVVAGGAVLLLAIALAYTEALGRWGSPELVGWVDDFRNSTRSALGAVPHPIDTLLGIPALIWGVFMRARRRQGWWVCAFGVAVTAPTTGRLADQGVSFSTTMLGLAYSLVLGLVLGYAVIRVEQAFTGTRGRRARRVEEAQAHRPEPGRLHALN
jgi:hypothetical protein